MTSPLSDGMLMLKTPWGNCARNYCSALWRDGFILDWHDLNDRQPKEMAGETLRIWLTKFTGTPLKSLCSGIGLTLIVQSSTATTLATIGFVGAGVLSFTQAIGVIIGANIGTSSTWLDGGFAGGEVFYRHFCLTHDCCRRVAQIVNAWSVGIIRFCACRFWPDFLWN